MSSRIYIIYDERAMQDTDEASIYQAGCRTLQEAVEDAQTFKPCVIYSYRENGKVLEDEKFEVHLS